MKTITAGRWSVEDEEYLKANYRRNPTSRICAHLGRSIQSVHSTAHILRMTRRVRFDPRRTWTAQEDEHLKSSYGAMRPSMIARALGRSVESVYHRAEDLGLFSKRGSGEFSRRQSLSRTARPFTGLADPAEAGYMAGIIDGEGSMAKPPRITVSVGSTTKGVVERLRDIVGGSVTGPYRYETTKVFGDTACVVRPQYHWNLTSQNDVHLLLKRILQSLVVKRRSGIRAMAYFERRRGWGSK